MPVALAPPEYWRRPVGLWLAAMLAVGSVASVIALIGRIGRDRRVQGALTAVSSPAPDVTEMVCQLGSGWRGQPFCNVSRSRRVGTRCDPATSGVAAALVATVLPTGCNPAWCGRPPGLRERQLMAGSSR